MDKLSEIKRRADGATPGPWNIDITGQLLDDDDKELPRSDFAFIGHAREDIPWLISEIEKRDRVIEEAIEALNKCKHHTGLDKEGFGDRTPLSLAASLGLVDIEARNCLAAIEKELGNG